MDATQHEQQAHLEANKSGGKFQLRRVLFRTRRIKRYVDRQKSNYQKRHRYHKYLSALVGIAVPSLLLILLLLILLAV